MRSPPRSIGRQRPDKPFACRLHNIPLGPNRWRQYRIRFDVERSEVVITIGPIVNAALAPLDETGQRVARVKTKAKIDYTYEGEMTADIWNGPSFAFVPVRAGSPRPRWKCSSCRGIARGVIRLRWPRCWA